MIDIQAMTDAREALENSASDHRRAAVRHTEDARICRGAAIEAQAAADVFDKHICAAIDAASYEAVQNLKVTT
jgi:hypothetical protein